MKAMIDSLLMRETDGQSGVASAQSGGSDAAAHEVFPAAVLSGTGPRRVVCMGDGENDEVAAYLCEMGRIPVLTEQQEYALAERAWHGDVEAKRGLTQANLRLVVSVARKYLGRDMELLDLIQEGSLGLMHAVEGFDYRRGNRFCTYAYWWIHQAISRALEERSGLIHIPSYAHKELRQLKRAQSRFLQVLGREPRIAELVEATGIDAERIWELQRAATPAISLDEPIGSEAEDQPLGTLLPDSEVDSIEDQVAGHELSDDVEGILKHTLTPRELLVVQLRFGLGGRPGQKLGEVGRQLSLSRERVRQIEAGALGKLRHSPLLKSLY